MKAVIIVALSLGLLHSAVYRLGDLNKEQEKKSKSGELASLVVLLLELCFFILAIIFTVRL